MFREDILYTLQPLREPELHEIVCALIARAEKMKTANIPQWRVERTIDLAERLNCVLKDAGANHFTNDKFKELRKEK